MTWAFFLGGLVIAGYVDQHQCDEARQPLLEYANTYHTHFTTGSKWRADPVKPSVCFRVPLGGQIMLRGAQG